MSQDPDLLKIDFSTFVLSLSTSALYQMGMVEGPDGSRLVFGSIGLRSAPGRSFQGRGVVPDIPVRIDIDTIRQIGFEEALELYNEHINAGIQLALDRLLSEEADEP